MFTEPGLRYYGIRFGYDLGELNNIAFIVRMRLVPLRNLRACISPDNAWIFLQGIETLPLRMQKHCDNVLQVAQYLQRHSLVNWIRYPGLRNDPSYNIAKKYFKNGFGAVVVFGIKGGYEATVKFIDNLNLISHLANIGDAKSLALHPSSTSHSQLTEEEKNSYRTYS